MKTKGLFLAIGVVAAMLLAGCGPRARVGELRTESQSVELGNARSVSVEIKLGAGDLKVTGGAEKLLEADFNYNVDRLKPEVKYTNDRLVVRQPEADGLPNLTGISNFRNEWDLRLFDKVPMDLRVDMGAGSSDLKLAGLSLTALDVTLGAGEYTIDLSGGWTRNLDVKIDSGAALITVRLPKDVGARVSVESGPHLIETAGLTQSGGVYTNAAYGVSDVTVQINIAAGIGQINLAVEE